MYLLKPPIETHFILKIAFHILSMSPSALMSEQQHCQIILLMNTKASLEKAREKAYRCKQISSFLISDISSLIASNTNLIISVCQAYTTIHFNKVEFPAPLLNHRGSLCRGNHTRSLCSRHCLIGEPTLNLLIIPKANLNANIFS